MKIRTILGDVLRGLFHRPATRLYPIVRAETSDRLRGRLRWTPDKCTGCALCVKDCPAAALELIDVDRANKLFRMRYHVDRCTFCAQCVQSCRFKCIELCRDDWELAALTRDAYTIDYREKEAANAVVE
jgi:formate hydrogenlyase subunit 6/NADH:ubiquinone oxidoreductase subunit I